MAIRTINLTIESIHQSVNRVFSAGICLLILNDIYIGSHVLRAARAVLVVCKSKGLRVTVSFPPLILSR